MTSSSFTKLSITPLLEMFKKSFIKSSFIIAPSESRMLKEDPNNSGKHWEAEVY